MMVYTITFNPALDYVVKVKDYKEGKVNRSFDEKLLPGGKGINVSQVLSNLGIENTALGFVAGFTGSEIERLLEEKGVKCDFIRLQEGNSRINVKLKSEKETEINATGPKITEKDVESLFEKLEKLKNGDFLVLAGSIPKGIDSKIYSRIMEKCRNINVIVDAEKELLKEVLHLKPFMVKPNHIELGELFGVEIKSFEDAKMYAEKLVEMGAENVFVSMAEKGGVFVNKKEVFYTDAPMGEVVNSTGAGDSAVAGFIAGYMKNENYEKAFKMGICAGSASAFSENLATRGDINKIEKMLISDSE